VKLIALKKLGRTMPGDIFELRDQEARALIVMQIAKPYEATETRDLVAVEAPRQRRRYQRRDLTAAD
jgi:hypothetical protein